MNRPGPGVEACGGTSKGVDGGCADINWPMRACILSLHVRRDRRCIAAVPRREFITSISFVYITRSIQIDSLSGWRWCGARVRGGKCWKRGGIYSLGGLSFDKNNNSARASAVFRQRNNNGDGNNGTGNIVRAHAISGAGENFIPFVRVNVDSHHRQVH